VATAISSKSPLGRGGNEMSKATRAQEHADKFRRKIDMGHAIVDLEDQVASLDRKLAKAERNQNTDGSTRMGLIIGAVLTVLLIGIPTLIWVGRTEGWWRDTYDWWTDKTETIGPTITLVFIITTVVAGATLMWLGTRKKEGEEI